VHSNSRFLAIKPRRDFITANDSSSSKLPLPGLLLFARALACGLVWRGFVHRALVRRAFPSQQVPCFLDQYQISTDKHSGITNDPNREDDPQYIVRLIGQVVTLSLETVKIVRSLPALGLPE
jgi:hypothetical protein